MTSSNRSILFIAGVDPEQGAPHQTMAAAWLAKRGFDVLCLCKGPLQRTSIETPLGVLRVKSVPERSGRWASLRWQIHLLWALLCERFSGKHTLYYVHGSVVSPASRIGLLGVSSQRIVYHSQDYLEPGRHPLWAFWEKRIAHNAAAVICNEPNRSRFMASNYRLPKLPITVRTALPKNWLKPARDPDVRCQILASLKIEVDDDIRLILHQGAFSSVRCSEQLFCAFSHLPERYVLVMTGVVEGNSSDIECRRAMRKYALDGRVAILQRTDFSSLLKYTAACDVGILLYPNDGIGNFYQAPGRLTEYLSCGLPVITSNFPGLELLTLKYNIGIACDCESPVEIASAIQSLCDRNENSWDQERFRLQNLTKYELAYETQAVKIEDLLNELFSYQL